ncbi:hypothetical protein B0W48_02530 [Pseudoalteromonas aliena]|uniref:Uncharacterized protein n=1 Tax=Pseudoalteromonas aliena TaxID=247523 RepID=A0A1Q2GUV5_9GAMM|nr:hypothetical protein [Pseudoalteromonas aliena]AQP98770.1 hypothetical protein B0W48_02530 [Pseudoalteromonas aliena]
MAQGKNKKLLIKKTRKGNKGFPIATIAFYGPNRDLASKAVCAIIMHEGAAAEPMKKWFASTDLRKSELVMSEILNFIDANEAKSVSMIQEVIGCPHEEGIDYPVGCYCPECNYWKGRDRFSAEMVH